MSGPISFAPAAPPARTIELLRQQVADLEGIIARDNENLQDHMEIEARLEEENKRLRQALAAQSHDIGVGQEECRKLQAELERTRAWLPGGMGVPG